MALALNKTITNEALNLQPGYLKHVGKTWLRTGGKKIMEVDHGKEPNGGTSGHMHVESNLEVL